MYALLMLLGAVATTAPADLIVNNFEGDTPPSAVVATNAMAVPTSDDPPAEGRTYMRLQANPGAGGGKPMLRLRVTRRDATPAGRDELSAAMRVPGATQAVDLRWLAFDGDDRPLFQRRFELKPGEQWVRLHEPLRTFRWDDRRVGDWDEVRGVALVVNTPGVARVDIDDVRFTGVADEKANEPWLMKTAFADRRHESSSGDGLLVATDAVDGFTAADLDRLREDMARTRAWLRRVFGDADRPTDDQGQPAALLVFADTDAYRGFFERLGEQWRVKIAPPQSQGYTVQSVAASSYDAKLGPRRPVYTHESVHVVVARELRLLSGHGPHRPIQEGIATYLQLCLHPSSLSRSSYVKNFATPIDATGGGFFKPLDKLFAQPVTTTEYAQLASVIAYLVERDEPLLRDLARSLADGETAAAVLQRRGTTWPKFEAAWFAWGRERFAADKDAPAFAPPAEFR